MPSTAVIKAGLLIYLEVNRGVYLGFVASTCVSPMLVQLPLADPLLQIAECDDVTLYSQPASGGIFRCRSLHHIAG